MNPGGEKRGEGSDAIMWGTGVQQRALQRLSWLKGRDLGAEILKLPHRGGLAASGGEESEKKGR